jgi:hypothetical protein
MHAMMADSSEKSIFLAALDLETPAEREAYLAGACGSDAGLRRAVDRLLAAHACPQNLLDRVPEHVAAARGGSKRRLAWRTGKRTALSPRNRAGMLTGAAK